MLPRKVKETFYMLAGPLMRINMLRFKIFKSASINDALIHLGPGQKNYIPGWLNVDANMFTAKCDLWADLRYKLPFRDGSCAAVYSHHMIEHLPDISKHVNDVYRILKPGGIYRVCGPNGDSAVKMFLANKHDWFGDFPDKRDSIGGRFENFIFCRGEHLTILTESYLRELLSNAGFKSINIEIATKSTGFPNHFSECLSYEFENDFEYPHTIVVEALK